MKSFSLQKCWKNDTTKVMIDGVLRLQGFFSVIFITDQNDLQNASFRVVFTKHTNSWKPICLGVNFFVDLLLILTHPQNGLILIAFFFAFVGNTMCHTDNNNPTSNFTFFKKSHKRRVFYYSCKGRRGVNRSSNGVTNAMLMIWHW